MFSQRLSLISRSTVVGGLVALGVAPPQASTQDVAKGPTSFEMDIYWGPTSAVSVAKPRLGT